MDPPVFDDDDVVDLLMSDQARFIPFEDWLITSHQCEDEAYTYRVLEKNDATGAITSDLNLSLTQG